MVSLALGTGSMSILIRLIGRNYMFLRLEENLITVQCMVIDDGLCAWEM
jgi:hypothetical protein